MCGHRNASLAYHHPTQGATSRNGKLEDDNQQNLAWLCMIGCCMEHPGCESHRKCAKGGPEKNSKYHSRKSRIQCARQSTSLKREREIPKVELFLDLRVSGAPL